MKRRIVAAMLAGVMALGMLAGCGAPVRVTVMVEAVIRNHQTLISQYSTIPILILHRICPYSTRCKLDEMGVEYQDYDGNSNQTTQNEQIDTAIQTGATALIVNIVTSGSVDASSQIVEKAEAAGSRLSSLTVQSKMTKQKEMYLEAMTSVHS